MTVRDLLAKLQAMPDHLDVVIYPPDSSPAVYADPTAVLLVTNVTKDGDERELVVIETEEQ